MPGPMSEPWQTCIQPKHTQPKHTQLKHSATPRVSSVHTHDAESARMMRRLREAMCEPWWQTILALKLPEVWALKPLRVMKWWNLEMYVRHGGSGGAAGDGGR